MTAEEKPIVYILHGNDELEIKKYIDAMISKLGDPGTIDLNVSRLDGRQASDDDLRSNALAIPFLAERRLVILTNPLARLNSKENQTRFISFLDSLPETTALVLVVEDEFLGGKKGWSLLKEKHWLRKWANGAGGRALLHTAALPGQRDMPGWIIKQAKSLGGSFLPPAAAALADITGNDTQTAGQEIIKLLTYVDYARAVEVEDVQQLTAPGGQADVFEMVDAMAMGNTRVAIRTLHKLLEEQDPYSLFGMVVRQFRLLIQAREIIDQRGTQDDVARLLYQHPFVAQKITTQARRFSFKQLKDIYHRLLESDQAMKTGKAPPDLALESFVASLGNEE